MKVDKTRFRCRDDVAVKDFSQGFVHLRELSYNSGIADGRKMMIERFIKSWSTTDQIDSLIELIQEHYSLII